MIYIGKKEITGIYVGRRIVTAVYVGTRLVWQAVSSCFGAGYWQREKRWKRGDGWKRGG